MPHFLVTQLRFARSEFQRALDGVTDEAGGLRFGRINSIGWMVGHLADQEHRYWVILAQGRVIAPGLNDLVGFGKPASTPSLAAMWATWREVTAAADPWLDALTDADLSRRLTDAGQPLHENIGTMLLRNTDHYWFHAGEGYAVRQMLGHTGLPDFVGRFGHAAWPDQD